MKNSFRLAMWNAYFDFNEKTYKQGHFKMELELSSQRKGLAGLAPL